MSITKVNCGKIEISNNNKICIIAGPCQLETEQHAMDMAGKIKEITDKFKVGFIYKTSFDKANRTSLKGKRGAGLDASLPVFDKIRKELDIPVLTDIHNIEQCSIWVDDNYFLLEGSYDVYETIWQLYLYYDHKNEIEKAEKYLKLSYQNIDMEELEEYKISNLYTLHSYH